MNRRDFMKHMGIAATVAGVGASVGQRTGEDCHVQIGPLLRLPGRSGWRNRPRAGPGSRSRTLRRPDRRRIKARPDGSCPRRRSARSAARTGRSGSAGPPEQKARASPPGLPAYLGRAVYALDRTTSSSSLPHQLLSIARVGRNRTARMPTRRL